MIRPDSFLEDVYARVTQDAFSSGGTNPEAWKLRRQLMKVALSEKLGLTDIPVRTVVGRSVLEEEVDCGSYVRQRLLLDTGERLTMPMYALIPKEGPAVKPAVLAVHGHGYGAREVIGLQPDGSQNEGPNLYHNFAVELAGKGFIVLVPELLGFGERRLEQDADLEPKQNSCQRLATTLLTAGTTLAGVRIYEMLRALDYLEERPDVDSARIGGMGMSGGAMVAAFLAALDERVRAIVLSGYVNTFRDSILSIRHCVDNYVPGLLQVGELPDLVGLIAPRPLLVESGEADRIFPVHGSKAAISRLAEIYGFFNASEQLVHDLFEGGHEISGRLAYDWLEQQL
ncbi:dienelactone hydrolase family protein [Paenibacillus sp. y28]|uniref:dienelactone hydrolase family protein n=1 Tax=Paenibacillus sp. y28 TaxID=3129110 RepID=UPI00301B11E7